MMGTPAYMAPEQAQDAASADIRADIYSLGCTLYFLLTGAPPFTGKSAFAILQAHVSTEATPLSRLRAEVPAELAAIVAKMMAKDPAGRFQKPIEAAKALAPFIKVPPPLAKILTVELPTATAVPTAEASKPREPAPAVPSVFNRPTVIGRGARAGAAIKKPTAPNVSPPDREGPHYKISSRWLISTLVVIFAIGGMTAVALWAINHSVRRVSPDEGVGINPEGDEAFNRSGNFRFTPPGAPWQGKPGLFGATVAYRRSNPSSSLALVFHDYHTRLPRQPELIDNALNKLRGAMSDIEYEVKPKDENSTFGGQPAVRLEFQGGDHDVPVHGECVAMAYRGVAYWFYTWAPVDDAPGLADEWAGLRGNSP